MVDVPNYGAKIDAQNVDVPCAPKLKKRDL